MNDILNQIKDKINEIQKVETNFKSQILVELLNVKDTSYITRLNDTPSAFTLKFSNLGNDWTAGHHDCKHQARCLIEFISNKQLNTILKELSHIKQFKTWSNGFLKSSTGIAHFNNEFINQLFNITANNL